MTDDEIAELLRRADPARTTLDARSEGEVDRDLARITGAARPPRHRAWLLVPAAAVLVVAMILTQAWSPFAPAALAVTPPMLPVTPVAGSVEDVLTQARLRLAAEPASEAVRQARFQGWYLDHEIGGEEPRTVISPQQILVEWRADRSGRMVVTAGAPYLAQDGSNVLPPDDKAPPAGTVLSDDEFPAGEMPVLYTKPPPQDVPGMTAYLATGGAERGGDPLSYVHAIRYLLSEWTLSGTEESAALGVLSGLDGLAVVGAVTDRLGRPAVALLVTSTARPQFETLLLLSTDTGRVLALETIYLGGLRDLDIPAPSVIQYTVWE